MLLCAAIAGSSQKNDTFTYLFEPLVWRHAKSADLHAAHRDPEEAGTQDSQHHGQMSDTAAAVK